MKEKLKKFREYLDYVERHYNNVQKAWELISSKCKDKDFRFMNDDFIYHGVLHDVINHDESKLSAEEFTQYRNFFFPCKGEDKDQDAFNEAWEHHKENNSHHWQNWTEVHKDNPYADLFLVTMLIDWVAMGYEFNNTAQSYYEKNKDNIDLPEWAIELMYRIFKLIYPKES